MTTVTVLENNNTVTAVEQVVSVVSVAEQGPTGPQGVKGDKGDKGDTGEAYINIDGGTPTSVYGGIVNLDGGDVNGS